MNRFLLLSLFTLCATFLRAETEVEIAIRIGDYVVTSTEFAAAYGKNNLHGMLSAQEFAQLYATQKVKVLEARALRFDTLHRFEEQLQTSFAPIAAADVDNPSDFQLVHICAYIPQNASAQRQAALRRELETLLCSAKASGRSLAYYLAEIKQSAHTALMGEVLHNFEDHHTMPTLEKAIRELRLGEMSGVVESYVGLHLLQWLPAETVYSDQQASASVAELENEWYDMVLAEQWNAWCDTIELDTKALSHHLREQLGSKKLAKQWAKQATPQMWQNAWKEMLLSQCLTQYSIEFYENVITKVNKGQVK